MEVHQDGEMQNPIQYGKRADGLLQRPLHQQRKWFTLENYNFSKLMKPMSTHLNYRLLLCSDAIALIGLVMLPTMALAQLPSLSPTQSNPEKIGQSRLLTYVLGAGDFLDIRVYGYEEFTGTQVILPDGTITLPLVGSLIAGDKTAAELTQILTRQLNRLLVNPVVTVSLNKLRPVRVNVAGEVSRPGPVQLQSLSPVNANGSTNQVLFPTVSEAIALAGGITQDADIQQVVIKRYRPSGDSQPITINLWEGLRSENTLGDPVLLDGDSVYIPKITSTVAFADRRLLARATYSPKTVRVRVSGEVRTSGEIEVRPSSNLSSAIAIAGTTDKSQLKRVVLVRLRTDGKVERRELNLQDLADNEQVQEGDVLIVPKNNARNILDIASQIASPLGLLLNLFIR